jgi:hypothetical protein
MVSKQINEFESSNWVCWCDYVIMMGVAAGLLWDRIDFEKGVKGKAIVLRFSWH